MAGRCVVHVSPELVAEMVKYGMDCTRVIEDAIPADAMLVEAGYAEDRRAYVLVFHHSSFPDGEHERTPVFQRMLDHSTY